MCAAHGTPGPDHPFRHDSRSARLQRMQESIKSRSIRLRSHGLEDPEERVRSNKHFIQPSAWEEWDEDPFEALRDPYEDKEGD